MGHEPKSSYTITLDDDPMVHRMIQAAMGVKSLSFASGATFLSRAERYEPIGIFVDIHLGVDESGLDLIPRIRTRWPYAPLLVVTGDRSSTAIGVALAAGANDFIKKPIEAEELLARFQARATEMTGRSAENCVNYGDIRIDRQLNCIQGEDETRYLSHTDVRILLALVEAKSTVIAKDALKGKIWGDIKVSDNALDKKIYEVRQALADVSKRVKILAAYGQGLKITDQALDSKKTG